MKRAASVFAACVLMTACGGGGGGSGETPQTPSTPSTPSTPPPPTTPPPSPPPVANALPGGIWEGSLGSGEQVIGLITESGEFHFVVSDGTQYFGTLSTSGEVASGQFTGYSALAYTFDDGSTRGSGTLSGTLEERSTLTADLQFQTASGSTVTNTVSLTYDALYERDSSIAVLAGDYLDLNSSETVTIGLDGTAHAANPVTGCELDGAASIIDAQYNVYRVEYTYNNCTGQDAVLNGVTFSGFATLDNTTLPERIVLGAQALIGSTGVARNEILERS